MVITPNLFPALFVVLALVASMLGIGSSGSSGISGTNGSSTITSSADNSQIGSSGGFGGSSEAEDPDLEIVAVPDGAGRLDNKAEVEKVLRAGLIGNRGASLNLFDKDSFLQGEESFPDFTYDLILSGSTGCNQYTVSLNITDSGTLIYGKDGYQQDRACPGVAEEYFWEMLKKEPSIFVVGHDTKKPVYFVGKQSRAIEFKAR